SEAAAPGKSLTAEHVAQVVARACPVDAYRGKRVLVIVPDGTRTAPVGLLFQTLHKQIGAAADLLDVMIALGTHQPMSEQAICERLEMSSKERASVYSRVKFHNHEWNNRAALRNIGTIPAKDITALTNGLFSMDVPVEIHRRVFDYDQLIIVGPVFPHEVVGFS